MKIIWEEGDITPGRRYSKVGLGENWIIGFLQDAMRDARYVSISDRDGMVTLPCTKQEMAVMLTREGYLPVELL